MAAPSIMFNISSLPTPVLFLICRLAGKSCREVCRLFHEAYGAHTTCIRPRHLNTASLVESALVKLPSRKSLKALDLSCVTSSVQDSTLHLISQHFPKLQTLDLSGCAHLTGNGLGHLFQLSCVLTSLDLTACKNMTFEDLRAVARLTSLQQLHFPVSEDWCALRHIHLLHPLAHLTKLGFDSQMDDFNITPAPLLDAAHVASLASMTQLRHLTLPQDGMIPSDALPALTRLQCMTHLDLGRSLRYLDSHALEVVAQLSALRFLCLELNHISQACACLLSSLKQLQHLNISAFDIDVDAVQHLAAISSLLHLSLSQFSSPMHDDAMQHMRHLPAQLQSLSLQNQQLYDLCNLQHLTALTSVHISPYIPHEAECPDLPTWHMFATSLCSLSDLELGSANAPDIDCLNIIVTHLPGLTRLCFDGELMESTGYGMLVLMPQLRHLRVDSCRMLSDRGLLTFSNLTELTSLSLSFNHRINGDGFVGLPHTLRQLSLGHCFQVTDSGCRYMSRLTSLEVLRLGDCIRIVGGGLQWLRGLSELRDLEMLRCLGLSDTGLIQGLVPPPTNLQRCSLNHCNALSDVDLRSVLKQHLPHVLVDGKH